MLRLLTIAIICTGLLIPIAGFSSGIISNNWLAIACSFGMAYVALPVVLLRIWPDARNKKDSSSVHEVLWGENTISIGAYPLRPTFRTKFISLKASEVVEADIERCVLRIAGELIYLPGWPREELQAFCQKNDIAVKKRYDIWSDLLAPFVDTNYSAEDVAEQNRQLRAVGYGRYRVSAIIFCVAIPMILYQGIAGEWVGLYHYDLLFSLRPLKLFGLYGFAYWATMKIALAPYLDCRKS